MRIWDINPGYLNRQSLLGEHRELHGIESILTNKKKGYSHHPETLRWAGFGWALKIRHNLLASEMKLRGYTEKSPLQSMENTGKWPNIYIDDPASQFNILKEKYIEKEPGRIPLPFNSQILWSQHKYSVLARDPMLYREIGRMSSGNHSEHYFKQLSLTVTETLRRIPEKGGILNSLQHRWGHVREFSDEKGDFPQTLSLSQLLGRIQEIVLKEGEKYLITSTSLSELEVWVRYHKA